MDNFKRTSVGKTKRSGSVHKTVKKSETLNRKYLKKNEAAEAQPVTLRSSMTVTKGGKTQTVTKTTTGKKLTAVELKERAIERALAQMNANADSVMAVEEEVAEIITKKRRFWQKKRFVVSMVGVFSVILLGAYFTYLNMNDMSVQLAAAAAGVDAKYPDYLPHGYALDGVVSSNDNKVVMTFSDEYKNQFSISEEKTSLDTVALRDGLVAQKWGSDFVALKEAKMTIFTHKGGAMWVSGGMLFKIDSLQGELTRQQLRDIAVGLV